MNQLKKYHINKNGDVKPCHAQLRECRFGGDDTHYTDIKDALQAAEKKNEQEFQERLKDNENDDSTKLSKNSLKKNSDSQKNTAKTPAELLNVRYGINDDHKEGYFNETVVKGVLDYTHLNEKSYEDLGFKEENKVKLPTGPARVMETEMWMNEDEISFLSEEEVDDLNPDEREAVIEFTGDSYEWINDVMFSKDPLSVLENNERDVEEIVNIVKNMDSALAAGPRKQRTVYRGVAPHSAMFDYDGKIDVNRWLSENIAIGKEIVFDGYQSASPNPAIGVEYAGGYNFDMKVIKKRNKPGGILYEIITPEGLNIASISDYPEEQEVLLPRNARYTVVGIDTTDISAGDRNVAHTTIVKLLAINSQGEILDGTNSDKLKTIDEEFFEKKSAAHEIELDKKAEEHMKEFWSLKKDDGSKKKKVA